MPYISTEVLVTVGLIAVLAIGSQLLPKATKDEVKAKAKKKKNKKAKIDVSEDKSSPEREEKPKAVLETGKKGKGKKKVNHDAPKATAAARTSSASSAPSPAAPVSESESDEAFPGLASSTQPKKTKDMTLAERIKAKPKATLIDDMLAPEDRPKAPSRVVGVGSSASKPVQKVESFADDYESDTDSGVEGRATGSGSGSVSISLSGSGSKTVDDDGWDVVPVKSKKPQTFSINNKPKAPTSTAQPLPVATKLQRKNQAQSAAKKAQKDAEEADRLRRLAEHRRGLERERINEIYKQIEKNKAKGGKVLSGGQKATIDTNGKLVWD